MPALESPLAISSHRNPAGAHRSGDRHDAPAQNAGAQETSGYNPEGALYPSVAMNGGAIRAPIRWVCSGLFEVKSTVLVSVAGTGLFHPPLPLLRRAWHFSPYDSGHPDILLTCR
jgi:hypothetical protein